MLKSLSVYGVFIGLVILSGCGGKDFNRVPVAGTIACEGISDPSGYIIASPTTPGTSAPNASATIENGRFTFGEGQEPVPGEYMFEFHFLESKTTTQSSDGEIETGPTIAYRTKVQIPDSGSQSLAIELSTRERIVDDSGY